MDFNFDSIIGGVLGNYGLDSSQGIANAITQGLNTTAARVKNEPSQVAYNPPVVTPTPYVQERLAQLDSGMGKYFLLGAAGLVLALLFLKKR